VREPGPEASPAEAPVAVGGGSGGGFGDDDAGSEHSPDRPAHPPGRVALAWLVHLYTALGAVTALVSISAIAGGRIAEAMWWLYVAVFIDATDGTAARAVGVKQVLPGFDGAKLDDIVDYLTFVLVPMFFLLQTGLLQGTAGTLAAGAAVLASAFRFCSSDAKTPDAFFTGFPSYWNIVGLYLWVFEVPPAACAALTAALALLVLVPLRFIYPTRMPTLMGWTIGLGVAWSVLVGIVLLRLPERATTVAAISLAYPAYYTLASFWLDWKSRRES